LEENAEAPEETYAKMMLESMEGFKEACGVYPHRLMIYNCSTNLGLLSGLYHAENQLGFVVPKAFEAFKENFQKLPEAPEVLPELNFVVAEDGSQFDSLNVAPISLQSDLSDSRGHVKVKEKRREEERRTFDRVHL